MGNSDHYTLLPKILWKLTKLLITAQSSLRGWLFPASNLIARYFLPSTAIHTTGCLFWDVVLSLTPFLSAQAVFSAVLPLLVSPLASSAAPLGNVFLRCTFKYVLHNPVTALITLYCNWWSRYHQPFLDWEFLEDRN